MCFRSSSVDFPDLKQATLWLEGSLNFTRCRNPAPLSFGASVTTTSPSDVIGFHPVWRIQPMRELVWRATLPIPDKIWIAPSQKYGPMTKTLISPPSPKIGPMLRQPRRSDRGSVRYYHHARSGKEYMNLKFITNDRVTFYTNLIFRRLRTFCCLVSAVPP